jgi:hypothetical protein
MTNVRLLAGAVLKIYDGTSSDQIQIYHNGTDAYFNFTNTTDVNFTGFSGSVVIEKTSGSPLVLRDSDTAGAGATVYLEFQDSGGTAQANIGTYPIINSLYLGSTGNVLIYGAGGTVQLSAASIWADGSVFIAETASAVSSVAAKGQFWVKSDTPNTPWFTDDAGGDQLIDPSVSEINTQNGAYTLVLGDKGKTIHKATSTASITHTIPANASVAFPLGTLVAFKNSGTVDMTIAITSDTLTGTDGSTGSRTLGAYQTAVIQKMTATTWEYVASDL